MRGGFEARDTKSGQVVLTCPAVVPGTDPRLRAITAQTKDITSVVYSSNRSRSSKKLTGSGSGGPLYSKHLPTAHEPQPILLRTKTAQRAAPNNRAPDRSNRASRHLPYPNLTTSGRTNLPTRRARTRVRLCYSCHANQLPNPRRVTATQNSARSGCFLLLLPFPSPGVQQFCSCNSETRPKVHPARYIPQPPVGGHRIRCRIV